MRNRLPLNLPLHPIDYMRGASEHRAVEKKFSKTGSSLRNDHRCGSLERTTRSVCRNEHGPHQPAASKCKACLPAATRPNRRDETGSNTGMLHQRSMDGSGRRPSYHALPRARTRACDAGGLLRLVICKGEAEAQTLTCQGLNTSSCRLSQPVISLVARPSLPRAARRFRHHTRCTPCTQSACGQTGFNDNQGGHSASPSTKFHAWRHTRAHSDANARRHAP